MIMKLPAVKVEEGKKFRGSPLPHRERVSILLELADALRLNGELVSNTVPSSLGTGASWRLWVNLGASSLILQCWLVLAFGPLFNWEHAPPVA